LWTPVSNKAPLFSFFHKLCWKNSWLPNDHVVGDSDRWCSDICSTEGKHTDTIFYVVRQITYIHGRESILFRD
jgi:hypothetical protein